MEAKIVVWKNGNFTIVMDGVTWEYENDSNWLTTIEVPQIRALIEERDALKKLVDPKWVQYAKMCIREVENEKSKRDAEYRADKEYR